MTKEQRVAQIQLLEWLMGVAEKTQGAEVWRYLFLEMRGRLLAEANQREAA